MAQVEVMINGRGYTIACDDGQEGHVQSLAADLDQRVSDIAGAVGHLGDARLLVMAGLMLADELGEARAGNGAAPAAADTEDAAAAVDSLAARLEAIADKLSEA